MWEQVKRRRRQRQRQRQRRQQQLKLEQLETVNYAKRDKKADKIRRQRGTVSQLYEFCAAAK